METNLYNPRLGLIFLINLQGVVCRLHCLFVDSFATNIVYYKQTSYIMIFKMIFQEENLRGISEKSSSLISVKTFQINFVLICRVFLLIVMTV